MTRQDAPAPVATGAQARHPAGLHVLFFTEMWERFGYYGMRALLILFMTAAVTGANPGLGMDVKHAAAIYGWYTALTYMTAIPGGLVADRFLGHRRAVLLGGILMAIGYACLVVRSLTFFYAGLGFVIVGTGLLKPNISTMVGALYAPGDPRRDAGFSIFYMGINIGAGIAPIICGWLGEKIDWHWGFGAAAVGMVLGLVQFRAGSKRLGDVGLRPPARTDSTGQSAGAYAFSAAEWKRIVAIGVLFLFSAMFWGAFEQAGSSLNLFADRLTNLKAFGKEFPASWFQSVNSVFIVLLAPLFAILWVRLGKREPSSPAKFALGLLFVGLGFAVIAWASTVSGPEQARVSPMWLVVVYFLHTIGELCLSPVGLSTVTKLAPASVVGLMMGVWFLSISLGLKMGGWVAGFFESYPLPKLFGAVFLTTTAAAIILALLIKPIRKLMGGVH